MTLAGTSGGTPSGADPIIILDVPDHIMSSIRNHKTVITPDDRETQ